jgi:hypothetical protein
MLIEIICRQIKGICESLSCDPRGNTGTVLAVILWWPDPTEEASQMTAMGTG